MISEVGTSNVLNSRFLQLLNSLSGIRMLANLGSQHVDKNKLIETIMLSIIENLDVEKVSLFLLEDQSLECKAILDWDQYIKKESALNTVSNSYLLNEGIVGKTAANKLVMHIQNCNTTNEQVMSYKSNGNGVGSLICAPIVANEELLGVIELSHPDTDHFEAWQEHSIVIYTDLIGLLLNNVKFISDMQHIVDTRTKELSYALAESEKLRKRYEEMSVIDPLTKLYNRRYFFNEVASSLARAKRYSQSFTLLLMDLDHFKNVNDTFGHECGDTVLISISNIMEQFTRVGDTLARIGGEEFVLALPETNIEGAKKLAERIRNSIEEHEWKCKEKIIELTISIGLSSIDDFENEGVLEDDVLVSDILRKSDLALYHVKHNGRNGVKAFSEIP